MPWYLLLPLAAAFFYALGSVYVKRGLEEGASMDQSFHLTNFAIGVIFSPLFLLETQDVQWHLFYQPAITGLAFFFGGWLTFVAIRRGDVSLVTPLMGTKAVFVAIGITLLAGRSPSVSLWIAASLTAFGIFLMGAKNLHAREPGFIPVAAAALLSAATFALCDVFVRMWAEPFGAMTFLAISSVGVGVISIPVWLFQNRKSKHSLIPAQPARKFILWGAGLIGFQAVFLGLVISYVDDATGINVVYASRGLWTIALVGLVGHHLGNHERHTAGAAFWWRAIGTLLLTIGIVIAVFARL